MQQSQSGDLAADGRIAEQARSAFDLGKLWHPGNLPVASHALKQ
jgi:hypothetical protein